MNVRRKVTRFRSMDRRERISQSSWYLRFPFMLSGRLLLLAIYFPVAFGLSRFRVRFLVNRVVGKNFGHLALDPSLYVMSGEIYGRADYRNVMMLPPSRLSNRALFRYWGSHFTVIDNPLIVVLMTPFTWFRFITRQIYLRDLVITNRSGERMEHGPALDELLREKNLRDSDESVLKLTPEHERDGLKELERLGMPEGSWWVCLHVRGSGYYQGQHATLNPEDHPRNAEIETYFDAVQAIVDRGGWVVRIGDLSMPPLPPMENVIDYVHSNAVVDWMDVFLLGGCRFLLGSDSGTNAIALVFGRPVAAANYVPLGHGPLGVRDMYVPKLYRSESEERNLAFDEVFSTELRDIISPEQWRENGLTWVNNSAEEIRDMTTEMMDRLDSTASYSDEDESAQSSYLGMLLDNVTLTTFGTHSRVGREFLRKHADLLREPGE